MDGKDGSRRREKRIVPVDRFEVGRNQSGLPFMGMDDIRGKIEELTEKEGSLREEDETFRVVEVIAFGRAVEIFPVIEFFPADEIDWDVLIQMALIEIGLDDFISYGDLQSFSQGLNRKLESS